MSSMICASLLFLSATSTVSPPISNESTSHSNDIMCKVECSVRVYAEDGTSFEVTAKGGGWFTGCQEAGKQCAWNLSKKLAALE